MILIIMMKNKIRSLIETCDACATSGATFKSIQDFEQLSLNFAFDIKRT